MAYITPLYGGSDAQVDYRLGLGHGCGADRDLSYRTDGRERPLRWIGEGLSAFGVPEVHAGAELTTEQFEMAHRLVRGQHIATGEQLVEPKIAVPVEAKVPVEPLVAAIYQRAVSEGVAPEALFSGPPGRAWAAAQRALNRRGAAAITRVDDAVKLAEAAGVDPDEVWGADTVSAAVAVLTRPEPVRDAQGQIVIGPDGTPEMALVPQRVRVGVAGYDIGITVPKSMSVLLAFAPDEVTDRVERSYSDAVNRTFNWTESRTSYVKRGKHGDGRTARQEESRGFSGWVMVHRAARPVGDAPIGDPHWHVHITIGNLAQAVHDGKWLTVAAGGRELMRHAAAIDKVTQANIRATLYRELGVTFAQSDRTALWEVEHIPTATLELFSKRSSQVTEVLTKLGYDPSAVSGKERRIITRHSRGAKTETTAESDVTLREYWRAEALGAGQDPNTWMTAVFERYRAGHVDAGAAAEQEMQARHGINLTGLVDALTHPETGLTANKRRFSHLDAVGAVADALPRGATIAEVEQLTELALAHPIFVSLPAKNSLVADQVLGQTAPLAGSHAMAGGQLYTTGDITAAERQILAIAKTAHPDQARAVVAGDIITVAREVAEASQGFALSAEQRDVLTAILTNGRAVEAIEGPPGTGKTTLMRAARVAWEAAGYTVAGAATAAVAVQNLAAESGIESRTMAQWLYRIKKGPGLAGVDVLVLDEANLTSDRDRAILYEAAQKSGTKIVEVGDPKQLRGVGCGSMFGYLHALLDGPGLTENRRQSLEDERAALALFRTGRYIEALNRWDTTGGIIARDTADSGIAELAATWMRLAEGAPDAHTRVAGLLTLASTNEMVDRINHVIQGVRAGKGQLGKGRTFSAPAGREVTFRTGDHVLVRINDRFAESVTGDPVLNGYRGVVTGVGRRGVTVEWHQPDDTPGQQPHRARFSGEFIADGALELGYAMTTHKAEGLTVNGHWTRPDGTDNRGSVLVWGPGMDNPGLYVALSRDRGQVLLFGSREELEGEREHLLYGTPADQAALTDRVKAALAERAHATATNANDRPVAVDLGHEPNLLDRQHSPSQEATVRTEQELGPEQQLAAERAHALAEATQRWLNNPDARLTDETLTHHIAEHTRRGDESRGIWNDATETLNTWSGPVAQGQGPLVRQVDSHLAQLRHDTATVEQIVGHDATITDLGRTEREHLRAASLAQQQAEETSRLRPAARDRLLGEAQHHTDQARAAGTAAADLTTERNRLFYELSPESRHDVTMLSTEPDRLLNATRQELAHAEQNYPTERAHAQVEDEAAVGRFHERANEARQAITGHTSRRDALLDEQSTREQLPPAQRELETHWRDEITRRDQQRRQSREPDQPSTDLSLDAGYTPDTGVSPDHGPRL